MRCNIGRPNIEYLLMFKRIGGFLCHLGSQANVPNNVTKEKDSMVMIINYGKTDY